MSDAAEPTTPPPESGGNNKMILIILGVMCLLLLGGMGGMYFMLSKKIATVEASAKGSSEHGEEGAEGAEGGEGAGKLAAVYVSFEPPLVVKFPSGDPARYLQVTVQAKTRDELMKASMEANVPAIRDALLTLFAQQSSAELATPEGKEALRAKALEAVRNIMKNEGKKPDQIEGIFFTSFVID